MYAAVPSTAEVCGAVCGPATIRAMPKSMTLTSPWRVTMTFAGLMSRWMTPATCAYASASQIFSATSTACPTSKRPPELMKSSSVRPWMNSMTMNCVSPSAPES